MGKLSVSTILFFTWSAYGAPFGSNRVPGITSFKQCFKYHGLEKYLTAERIKDETEIILGTYNKPFTLISGSDGEPVEKSEYPFMAALGYGNESNKKYLCGGSLISEKFVLTAAHCKFSRDGLQTLFPWCLYSQEADRFGVDIFRTDSTEFKPRLAHTKYHQMVTTVRLGDLNIKNEDDDEAVQEFKVSKYIVHPNYRYPEKYNDIALIELDRIVSFTEHASPICLDYFISELYNANDSDVYAAGWGAVGYGKKQSDILLKFKLLIYDLDICHKTYEKHITIPHGILGDSQICAGAIEGLTDTCEGDSGGPLIYLKHFFNAHDALYVQIGVTSFGVPCGIAQLPAVYTKVYNYIKWIEDAVWPEANETLDPNRIIFPEV